MDTHMDYFYNHDNFVSYTMKYPEDFINKIIQGDCLEVLKKIPDKSVDLVITDPPYGIAYAKKGEPSMIGDYGNVLGIVLPEIYRVLKDNGACYIFTSFKMLGDWLYRFQGHFKMNNLIIWDKDRNSGLQMGQNYGYSYEMIFYGSKNLHKLNGYCDDVIKEKRKPSKRHPTEKPLVVIKKFIEMSSNKDELVLDPFLGSGTTAVAANQLGRKYIGIEISEKYCKVAEDRLKQEILI